MNFLRKLDVRARLVSAFLTVILGCSAVGLFGFLQAKTQLEAMATSGRELAGVEISLKSWSDAVFLNFTRSSIIIGGDDVALLARLQPDLKETSAQVDAGQRAVEKNLATDELRAAFQAVKDNRKTYTGLRKEAFDAYADGQIAEARKTWAEQAVPAATKYSESVQKMSEEVVAFETSRIESELKQAQDMQTLMLFGLVGIMVMSLLVAMGVSRSITQPLLRVQKALLDLKDGVLVDREVEIQPDLPGRLEIALRDTAASLRATIVEVSDNAAAVNASSQEIAHGTQDLSARTEATAASLEESASAIEEVTATVEANAQTCVAGKEQAQRAVAVSAQAQEVVAKVAGTMQGIETASQSITGVLALIDSIAFQTNILALNAAVEAARAGEQGRGFAVVASEVRSLAARSAEAAKEIKGIVEDTLSKVHAGTELSATAGSVMAEVTAAMNVMRNHMDDIANSSREQALGLAEISKAISSLDSSTQQNAALVEESSAAATALQENAGRLEGLTRSFQTA